MREAAATLLYSRYDKKTVDALFSSKGSSASAKFTIDNARIDGYENLYRFLSQGREKSAFENRFYDPQEVIGLYTKTLG